ncbi:MAG: NAD(P)/FAD-dependent oxidoreductase [Promethearchaeota archaeon]
MHDVAIVGAGPAGATAARYLAKIGYDVCVIDKDEFPRDKPCGGGFSPNLFDEFSYLKSRRGQFLKCVCRTGVLHSPNRRTVLKGRADMAVALRTDFDNVLYEEAIDAGASSINARAKSVSIGQDSASVSLSGGDSVVARVLIGADGVTSMVARTTGLNKKWSPRAVTACRVAEVPAAERFIDDIYTSDREYHFFANLGGLPGYGWVFPKSDTINVGLGIIGKNSSGLPERFNQFIKMLKRTRKLEEDADLSGTRGALIPTGGPIKETTTLRCILVGDSAGMVNPLTGGGIAYSMKAAQIGAVALGKCLEEEKLDAESLGLYQRLWRSSFGHEFGPLLLVQRVFTGPFTSALFEVGSRDTVLQETVSSMMSEGSKGRAEVARLAGRFLFVSLREALTP